MTTTTRKINWTTPKTQNIEVSIEIANTTHEIDLDGHKAGSEAVEIIKVSISCDGKPVSHQYGKPVKPMSTERNIPQGAYARIGTAWINEQRYSQICAAIDEMNAESLPCPNCGTYCWGDCKAN